VLENQSSKSLGLGLETRDFREFSLESRDFKNDRISKVSSPGIWKNVKSRKSRVPGSQKSTEIASPTYNVSERKQNNSFFFLELIIWN
jgi:hypothetical protein